MTTPRAPRPTTAPLKRFAVAHARQFQDIARCCDDFHSRYGGSEIAVLLAGAVSGRHARADYRDVRQGREIVQCEAVGVEIGRELTVGNAAGHGYGARRGVERDDFAHGLE